MDPIILPAALLIGGLWALAKGKPAEGNASTKQPTFTPESIALVTDTRIVDGQPVRFFKPDIASKMIANLAARSLQQVQVDGGGKGLLFEVVPPGGDLSVAQAALTAQAQGQVVLGTLSLALPAPAGTTPLLLFVAPGQRNLATPAGAFAVLLDIASVVQPAATPATPFDANLDPAIAQQVIDSLNDPNGDPATLRTSAKNLSDAGFPVAAQALAARATAIDLARKLADTQAGGTPFKIRSGDLPSVLAQYYTGDAMRWKEVAAINPGMSVKAGNLSPWKVGTTILLPVSWDVRSKPLPAPKQAAAKPAGVSGVPPESRPKAPSRANGKPPGAPAFTDELAHKDVVVS